MQFPRRVRIVPLGMGFLFYIQIFVVHNEAVCNFEHNNKEPEDVCHDEVLQRNVDTLCKSYLNIIYAKLLTFSVNF